MNVRKVFLLMGLSFFAGLLSAAYLTWVPVSVTQPDGGKAELFASGDEFYNWLHDKDGYTVKRNAKGWYVYLDNRSGEDFVYTGLAAGRDNPALHNLRPEANLSAERIGRIRLEGAQLFRQANTAKAPTTGTLNNLCIFIRFSDQPEFTESISTYDNMFNGTSGNTLQNYYLEASYNQLDIGTTFYPAPGTTVLSWQDSHPRVYYSPYHDSLNPAGYLGGPYGEERKDREFTLLVNAVNGVSSQVPSGLNLDGDNDGLVDNVCFIIRGSTDGWAELLWPHMWSIYDQYAYINGKRVYSFNFQLADFMTYRGVGVLCHEMFHTLGAPDLYHYSYNGISPAGSWDVMNSDTNPPQHMGAYMKHKYGHWIPSIPTLSAAGTYTLNPLTSATDQCLRINSTNSTREFFIVEFRKKTGTFESSIPGSGLLIYRINSLLNGNAYGPPDEVYLYRPNGTLTSNGSPSSANFSTETGRTSFNDSTNPKDFLWDNSLGGISLSAIGSAAGSTISFYYNPSTKPYNLSGESYGGSIDLTWSEPLTGAPDHYNIYRSGAVTGTSQSTAFTDTTVTAGNAYSYYVTAVTGASESPASNTAGVTATNWITASLGAGTLASTTSDAGPVNQIYRSLHGQSVYTVAELNAAGICGPLEITQLGFNITSLPALPLPDFTVRLKHTTASDTQNWAGPDGLTTVWSSASYLPWNPGWNMLTLATPFIWNGTDNLLVDTAFGLSANWTESGTTQYSTVPDGYRYTRSDQVSMTGVFEDNPDYSFGVSSLRPNLRLAFPTPLVKPEPPALTITRFGEGVRLSWEEVEHATRYDIYSSADPYAGFTFRGSTPGLNLDLTETFFQEYYYVRAVNEPARGK